MANTEKDIKEHYEKNLKAVEYVDMMTGVVEKVSDMHRFPLTFLHEILQSGKFKGKKLLELGSGAVAHFVAVASAFFPNIIMSDFVEDNCEELRRWLRGESQIQQLLDIPAEVEGYSGALEEGKKLLENRIRKTVKQVVRGDVLNDEILLDEVKPDVAPPYDFIISSLCLESSVPDLEGLVLALKRVRKLLTASGGLFLVGFLKGRSWDSGQAEFHYLEVSEVDVRNALKESGFEIVEMKIHDKLNFDYGHEGYYCLIAKKVEG